MNAYADADKKLTLKDVQGKVQSLAKSVSKTIDSLKKSNAASKDLKGQVKKLGETIKVFESQLAQIEKGGEIYKLVIEAQEGISGNIKMFESKISSGNLSVGVQKKFEALIERQQKLINNYGNLIVEMSERSIRLRGKIKELSSNKELVSATLLVNEQEEAFKQLQACLSIFDDIEKDIDELNGSAQKISTATPE